MQGAGGIGGLLSRVDTSGNSHSYLYDGNGNVGQLVDGVDSTIGAHYEYDAFGKIVYQNGPLATTNSFRFSSKYLDEESGLYYYGYRFYDPKLGRWINRDPIEEDGGLNLYGFVENDGINSYDLLGMWKATDDSSGESRRFYMWEKGDTITSLAEEVQLEASEFDQWGVVEIGSNDRPCVVSVPNVWISADLLQGGGVWDRIVNIGGSVGRFIGTDLFTWGFKILKPNTIQELRSTVRSNSGDLWGLAVFGHGTEDGYFLL
jgi:RHS repeat-associated protein